MKIRALSNGNILEMVDGEPQHSGEISRAAAQPFIDLGVFEEIKEARPTPELRTPEAPVVTRAEEPAVAAPRKGQRRR